MDNLSDYELMALMRENNEEAMAEIVRRYHAFLDRFFRRMGANHDVEDLIQETFVRLYRYRRRYTPKAKFSTFLFTLAKNVWFDRWRRWQRWLRIRGDLEYREKAATIRPEAALHDLDIQQALQGLPEKHRMVVVLMLCEGLSQAEAAEVLGVPVGTVKSRLHHALCKLREYLDEG